MSNLAIYRPTNPILKISDLIVSYYGLNIFYLRNSKISGLRLYSPFIFAMHLLNAFISVIVIMSVNLYTGKITSFFLIGLCFEYAVKLRVLGRISPWCLCYC